MIPAPEIPGHTVTGVLGSGGFATVYQTWQEAVGRETAVKVDSRVLHTDRDQRRFFREVNSAGRLSGHPHVIDVYDAGTLRDGRPFLVMELCPDGSLNDELRRNGPMNPELVCRIGTSLADALSAAHSAGILHRDIKPANILINRFGVVGLSDFGLASIIAASGEQSVSRDALTPAYAPPESFHEAEPTAAADLYSLAATLYALMAGRPPRFPVGSKAPGMATILALHGEPVADIPGVPPSMMAILRQCLEADPARRLPSAAVLRDQLGGLLGQPARGTSGLGSAPHPVRPPADSAPPLQDTASGYPTPSGYPSTSGPVPANTSPTADTTWDPARSGPATTGFTTGPTSQFQDTRPSGGSLFSSTLHGWRLTGLATAVGGGLALLALAAVLVGNHFLSSSSGPTGSGPSGPTGSSGSFGIATTTSNCPAAAVPGAGAQCPAAPECWAGLANIEGTVTINVLPCAGPHIFQTFAIGIMPVNSATFNSNVLANDPTVRAVCSGTVMLKSRVGQAAKVPLRKWDIEVVPPDEVQFDNGIRTYRCVARDTGLGGVTGSQFGP
ncbi:MAG TPA: protein kinase [Streptosporangiaceae bacterium]|nr:protein kinase [Streptosporangiaceae bacterium]